jgi:hypothetical protein
MYPHFFPPPQLNWVWEVTVVSVFDINIPASQCSLSSGPHAFWCHQKITVWAECEASYALLASPHHHLQIDDLLEPALGVQTDGNLKLQGLDYMLDVKNFTFQLLKGFGSMCSRMRSSIVVQDNNTSDSFPVVLCKWLFSIHFLTCWNTVRFLLLFHFPLMFKDRTLSVPENRQH